ncbi:HNH endonuclease family protein [Streptomyces arboris]|uniref:HNH endonuclease family protein n=1 Tax=Streptomyces arboris TaxID=2600619 RepID=UPI003BF4C0CF
MDGTRHKTVLGVLNQLLLEALGPLDDIADVALCGNGFLPPGSPHGPLRDSFKHWVDEDDDGCPTRQEVLLAEAVTAPQQGARCTLSGGGWLSYYDEAEATDAKKLDIDHMVPLAEAWDSGAHDWTPERREAYANDLDAERSLVAVTAKTNRSKADRDPAAWMPPAQSATCTYLVDWTATKLRWDLSADETEQAALLELAELCADSTVEYEPVA